MKKLLSILILSFFVKFSFAQGTTQEEYNYITKGYKVQIESGLDMKKGYSLTDMGSWSLTSGNEKRVCEFKGLIRGNETSPSAVMMIYKRTDIPNGAVYYICIPSYDASSEIWKQTLDFINSTFKDNNHMTLTVMWALMKFGSKNSTIGG